MPEPVIDFLEGLTPYQIREYRRRLQELDQNLRNEIKNKKMDMAAETTDKNNEQEANN